MSNLGVVQAFVPYRQQMFHVMLLLAKTWYMGFELVIGL